LAHARKVWKGRRGAKYRKWRWRAFAAVHAHVTVTAERVSEVAAPTAPTVMTVHSAVANFEFG